jgi:hypothetical protein
MGWREGGEYWEVRNVIYLSSSMRLMALITSSERVYRIMHSRGMGYISITARCL